MKYEFHVGDYVETVDGLVGWICRISDDSYIWWANKNTDFYSCSYRIPEELKCFNRIGQYDFTKKDDGKIKPLQKSWVLDENDSNSEHYFDTREVILKINEIVEVVNQLKEKVNGLA